MLATAYSFCKAKPVWQTGREREMNLTLLFKASVPKCAMPVLSLACSTNYVLYVNGKFVAEGPARTAHGFHRVDEHELLPYLNQENNVLSIHVNGSYHPSHYAVKSPSFLCAEITDGDHVIAYTEPEAKSFIACSYPERVQKVPRYSFQRLMSEVYRLTPDTIRKDTEMDAGETIPLSVISCGKFITREVYYADYEPFPAKAHIASGTISIQEPEQLAIPSYYQNVDYEKDAWKMRSPYVSFPMADLEVAPALEIQKLRFFPTDCSDTAVHTLELSNNTFADLDFGINQTGILTFHVKCSEKAKLYLTFDEIRTEEGYIDPRRLTTVNVLIWELAPGDYTLNASEVYTMRFLRIACTEGSCSVDNVRLLRVGFPAITTKLANPDKKLQAVFDAAVETFRQNVYDIYMDCPSRERAGWLCDSFFTARAEFALTGKCTVERAFLANFLLPDSFPDTPKGMLPMCYPAEQAFVRYIPNWAMFYVLELEEYLQRSGDRSLIDAAKEKLMSLLTFFRKYENEYGLLEKLESWVFVEWSQANKLVQDVNFPTNMLYARMKRALARLYHMPELDTEAEQMEDAIRQLSWYGLFFCDNALRQDGKLVLSGEHTEACQYYAFFCGVATPETHNALWNTLLKDFGPQRTAAYPEVYPANTFIGHYLRLDLLDRYGLHDQLLDNTIGYFYKMARLTGTLWENDTPKASCCHGFTSCILYWLDHCGKLI